jgi:predicted nucleic acid-binding protein
MLLLDAGVWVASKDLDDRFVDSARPLVLDPAVPVAALDLTLYEVANAIGARGGEREAALRLCRTVIARCGERVVAVDPDLMTAALEIAGEHGLTAYDAAYVAAARAHEWTLVSTDVADLVSKGLAVAPDAADYP